MTAETTNKYRSYRNTYNIMKRNARLQYYKTRAEDYKTNTKKLWQLINSTINKSKHSGNIISSITVNGLMQCLSKGIADSFGEFYPQLGGSLANKISPHKIDIDNYIRRIPQNENSMFMDYTSRFEIERMVKSLPNKTSCGHDQISNNCAVAYLIHWKSSLINLYNKGFFHC